MKNKFDSLFKKPYHIINLTFAGIILMIFIYSGIFSAEKNNYPIHSACANVNNHPCKSEGLSRSFSEIVRFRFESGKSYNRSGLRIFSFFLLQFFLRFIFSLILQYKIIAKQRIILVDTVISIGLYFYCFWGLLF